METKLLLTRVGLSFIKGTVHLNDHSVEGYFLVDTGCTVNIINNHYISKGATHSNQKVDVLSPGNIENQSGQVDVAFSIEKENYTETFTWLEQNHEVLDWQQIPVLGIIGLDFLCKYGIVIDNQRLSFNNVNADRMIEVDDCKFAFPMEFGITQYRMPVLGLSNGENEDDILALVDTGANMSIICGSSLNRMNFETEKLDDKYKIMTIGNSEDSRETVKLSFSLESIKGGKLHVVPFEGKFNICGGNNIYEFEGRQPLEAIIGNMFLAKNKFILDFGLGLMYCRQ